MGFLVTLEKVMTDTQMKKEGWDDEGVGFAIEPISASADGKRNAYVVNCSAVQQSLNYAACLNRIATLDKGDGPSDWSGCERACNSGRCAAKHMRQEEILAGKSIYFTARNAVAGAIAGARQWISAWNKPVTPPAPRRKGASHMLDVMGDLGSMADAINAPASPRAAAPVTAPTRMLAPIVARTGESPLQMAIRMKKERASAVS